jgi:hypothetical protein
MSWTYSFTARSKAVAKAHLEQNRDGSSGHFPAEACAAVCSMIDFLPDVAEDQLIRVETTGHRYASGDGRATGTGSASVHLIDVI